MKLRVMDNFVYIINGLNGINLRVVVTSSILAEKSWETEYYGVAVNVFAMATLCAPRKLSDAQGMHTLVRESLVFMNTLTMSVNNSRLDCEANICKYVIQFLTKFNQNVMD